MSADNASTLAGGTAGLTLLATVDWHSIADGELIKIGVALVLVLVGYFMYKGTPPPDAVT